jgi:hypothetical protein
MSSAIKNFLFAGLALTWALYGGPHFWPGKNWYGAFIATAIFIGLGIRDLLQARKDKPRPPASKS